MQQTIILSHLTIGIMRRENCINAANNDINAHENWYEEKTNYIDAANKYVIQSIAIIMFVCYHM